MKVLWLGTRLEGIEKYLQSQGNEAIFSEELLVAGSPLLHDCEFLVSFGYRYLLGADILGLFPRRAVNIHISYLPWNRGADPNPWSFLEDTPKGVSIHLMTEKLDAGDILCQEEIQFTTHETLRSSYDLLVQTAETLFRRHWLEIRNGRCASRSQVNGGSFHRKGDLDAFRHLLHLGWDTPTQELVGKALQARRGR